MSRIKIITTQTTPANATVTVQRGKCDSVTACSPLSGPVQRLMQPAIYANTDEMLDPTILDKTQTEKKVPKSGYTNPPTGNRHCSHCVRMWDTFGEDKNFRGLEQAYTTSVMLEEILHES